MKISQKFASVCVAAAVLAGGTADVFPSQWLEKNALHAQALAILDSGECGAEGDHLTWKLDTEGMLTIDGYSDSTAEVYAEKYNRSFVALDVETTPSFTTTTTTTTTATTTATASVTATTTTADLGEIQWGMPSVQVAQGEQFVDMPLRVYDSESCLIPVSKAFFDLEYDYEAIELYSISGESEAYQADIHINSAIGRVIIEADPKNAVAGPHLSEVVHFRFHVKDDTPCGMYPIQMKKFSAYDKNENEISDHIQLIDGCISVLEYLPTTTTTETTTTEMTTTVSDDNIVDSGSYGENLTWTLDKEGTLTFSGTGIIPGWGDTWLPTVSSIQKIVIEEGITAIETRAFESCTKLTSVSLPDTLKKIDHYAFVHCSALSAVVIPDSVTHVGYGAFADCAALKSVTLSDNLTYVGSGVFDGTAWMKAQLEKKPLVVESGVVIDGSACSGELVIPDGVKLISDYAFGNCKDITAVTVPESVTVVSAGAFSECDALTKITFENPDCWIYENAGLVPEETTIYGYTDSTAQAYAKRFDREFVALDAQTTEPALLVDEVRVGLEEPFEFVGYYWTEETERFAGLDDVSAFIDFILHNGEIIRLDLENKYFSFTNENAASFDENGYMIATVAVQLNEEGQDFIRAYISTMQMELTTPREDDLELKDCFKAGINFGAVLATLVRRGNSQLDEPTIDADDAGCALSWYLATAVFGQDYQSEAVSALLPGAKTDYKATFYACDVTGDGYLTADDANMTLRYYLNNTVMGVPSTYADVERQLGVTPANPTDGIHLNPFSVMEQN